MSQPDPREQLTVQLVDQALRAELRIPACFPADLLTEPLCMEVLQGAGLMLSKPVIAQLRNALENLETPIVCEQVIELTGQPPVHGEDGRFELAAIAETEKEADPQPEKPSSSRTNDRVDFYKHSAFVTVTEGQLLGRLILPTGGEDGCDLRGKVVMAKPGKNAQIQFDDSVQVEPDGRCLARSPGVLSYDGQSLRVSDCLQVNGSVDFTTGNIDVDGSVEIRQGVRDCFQVRATGQITVNGLIEAARLEAGGDLYATGGMAAKERGHVTVGGNLHARYLDNVAGTVKGDVHVDREMVNCEFAIGGNLTIERGSMIGGVTAITGSATIHEIGAEGGQRTELILGSAPLLERVLHQAREVLSELTGQLKEVDQELEILRGAGAGRTADQREHLTELMCEQSDLQQRCARLQAKCKTLTDHLERIRKVEISVTGTIHPGTVLVVGVLVARFDEPLKGPVWIGWDEHRQLVVRRTTQTLPLGAVAHTQAQLARSNERKQAQCPS